MSRFAKFILGLTLIVFVLACNVLTRPVRDAQDLVSTAESLATAIPVETLQSLPSAMPELDIPTGLPDIGNLGDPQGTPLAEWNDIPIPPSATAGEDSVGMYSYKANTTVDEITNYYRDEMGKLGWQELFSMPNAGSGALLSYQKDEHISTITISTAEDGVVLVILTYQ